MFDRIEADPKRETEQKSHPEKAYPKIVLSVDEFAEEFSISRPTAYKLVREIGFPAFHIGQRIFVNRKALQNWVDEQCRENPVAQQNICDNQ